AGSTGLTCVAIPAICHASSGSAKKLGAAAGDAAPKGDAAGGERRQRQRESGELECVPLELVAEVGVLGDDEIDQPLGIILADRRADRRSPGQRFRPGTDFRGPLDQWPAEPPVEHVEVAEYR